MPKTILIAAFEGWNDASQAATNVVRHLVSRYESQEVRHIDNEGFYDYQVARPMICSVQGRKRIIWPQTTFYDIAVSPMLHLLAQIAPEPNYRWEEYCRQTLRVAEDYDVSDVITLGSMFDECPHTRPLPLDISKSGMTLFICVFVQLAAALLAILVFDQVLVGQVLCGLTCLQSLLYTVFYWHYDKVY